MYGLPPEIDVSFLVHREVEQVCIGLHQVQIHFDDNVSISIEGRFKYTDRTGRVFEWQDRPSQAAGVVDSLGLVVSAVTPEPDGTLTLAFSAGANLTIFDDDKQYEAYQISKPGTTIVV